MSSLVSRLYKKYPIFLIEYRDNNSYSIKDRAIDYVMINGSNFEQVASLRPEEQHQKDLRRLLKQNAVGIAATVNDKFVGYCWARLAGQEDRFFKISDGVCYLNTAFVSPEYRGGGTFPAMQRTLIDIVEKQFGCSRCYGSIVEGNEASIRACKKAGVDFIQKYVFIRMLGRTLNKAVLKE